MSYLTNEEAVTLPLGNFPLYLTQLKEALTKNNIKSFSAASYGYVDSMLRIIIAILNNPLTLNKGKEFIKNTEFMRMCSSTSVWPLIEINDPKLGTILQAKNDKEYYVRNILKEKESITFTMSHNNNNNKEDTNFIFDPINNNNNNNNNKEDTNLIFEPINNKEMDQSKKNQVKISKMEMDDEESNNKMEIDDIQSNSSINNFFKSVMTIIRKDTTNIKHQLKEITNLIWSIKRHNIESFKTIWQLIVFMVNGQINELPKTAEVDTITNEYIEIFQKITKLGIDKCKQLYGSIKVELKNNNLTTRLASDMEIKGPHVNMKGKKKVVVPKNSPFSMENLPFPHPGGQSKYGKEPKKNEYIDKLVVNYKFPVNKGEKSDLLKKNNWHVTSFYVLMYHLYVTMKNKISWINAPEKCFPTVKSPILTDYTWDLYVFDMGKNTGYNDRRKSIKKLPIFERINIKKKYTDDKLKIKYKINSSNKNNNNNNCNSNNNNCNSNKNNNNKPMNLDVPPMESIYDDVPAMECINDDDSSDDSDNGIASDIILVDRADATIGQKDESDSNNSSGDSYVPTVQDVNNAKDDEDEDFDEVTGASCAAQIINEKFRKKDDEDDDPPPSGFTRRRTSFFNNKRNNNKKSTKSSSNNNNKSTKSSSNNNKKSTSTSLSNLSVWLQCLEIGYDINYNDIKKFTQHLKIYKENGCIYAEDLSIIKILNNEKLYDKIYQLITLKHGMQLNEECEYHLKRNYIKTFLDNFTGKWIGSTCSCGQLAGKNDITCTNEPCRELVHRRCKICDKCSRGLPINKIVTITDDNWDLFMPKHPILDIYSGTMANTPIQFANSPILIHPIKEQDKILLDILGEHLSEIIVGYRHMFAKRNRINSRKEWLLYDKKLVPMYLGYDDVVCCYYKIINGFYIPHLYISVSGHKMPPEYSHLVDFYSS